VLVHAHNGSGVKPAAVALGFVSSRDERVNFGLG